MSDVVWWSAAGALGGLIAGSFIATLVIRWPMGETLSGRSRCDACRRTLGWLDLIPLLNAIAFGGRCRKCKVKIDPRQSAIELTAALIGGVALFVAPGWVGIAGSILGWQLLALGALDAEHFWLPDRLTALLATSGIASAIAFDPGRLTARLIGGGLGFIALFLIGWAYVRVRGRRGLGAGDAKLMGGIGCWLGWQPLPLVLLGASLLGLIAALAMRVRGTDITADTRFPFGALLAVAVFPLWILTQA